MAASAADRRSFGVIPFRVKEKKLQFLLIQHSYGSKHWDFPKGRPDGDETPLVTARRGGKAVV